MRKCRLLAAAALVALSILASFDIVRSAGPSLEDGFIDPPDVARPRVWWHWTGGNITREGITKDLEWMKRVGIGGAQVADIGFGGGQVVEQKIQFFTPEWFDALKYAAAESDRLGLEMSIFSSSGWSLTGGPWVKPEQAMKKLVWSETDIQGPIKLDQKLPQPPSDPGRFGSLRGLESSHSGLDSSRGGLDSSRGGSAPSDTYYRDSIVLAFPTPPDEVLMNDLEPTVTTSGGEIDPSPLMDDIFETEATIVAGKDGIAWVQYEFPQSIRIKAVTLIAPGRGVPFGEIQKSDDGTTYRTLVELPGAVQYRAAGLKTYAFPETSARFVRVVMKGAAPPPDAVIQQTEAGRQISTRRVHRPHRSAGGPLGRQGRLQSDLRIRGSTNAAGFRRIADSARRRYRFNFEDGP